VISIYDLKRLEAYTKNLVDYHLIIDLVPGIARTYFTSKELQNALTLNYSKSGALLSFGLQRK
jgi:N-acetyltransferase 10